nr:hypothetical protein [uncultured Allomuricauda sp.]
MEYRISRNWKLRLKTSGHFKYKEQLPFKEQKYLDAEWKIGNPSSGVTFSFAS